jgi:5-methylcytosine-specific restriction endonuclease McrA
MNARHRAKLLAAARTDRTFEEVELPRVGRVLRGRCLHCRSPLVLTLLGEPVGDATLEHILPRCHGGGDDLENLALACYRCNSAKGVSKDTLPANDPELVSLVARLKAERMARWRDPPPGLSPKPRERDPRPPRPRGKGRRRK